jgi:hypothetical protein
MNMEGSKTFSPAYETDFKNGGSSDPRIFRVHHPTLLDGKECPSIRWLCRRGPVPPVYQWDTWSEE